MGFFIGDRQIPVDRPFKDDNGVQYPANWLRLATKEEKERAGIVEKEARVQPAKQTKRKTVVFEDLEDKTVKNGNKIVRKQNGDPVIRKGRKSIAVESEHSLMLEFLKDTDWYVIRQIETGEEIPQDVKKYRDEVRRVCASRCEKICACADSESFNELFATEQDGLEQYPVKPV